MPQNYTTPCLNDMEIQRILIFIPWHCLSTAYYWSVLCVSYLTCPNQSQMKYLLQTFFTPNFRNKKYISKILASVSDWIAWSSIGNNNEMWTICKYWRIIRSEQKLNKPNLERQWMTFVYRFYLRTFFSLVKDPNRCQRMEFKANRTGKLDGKIQFKKITIGPAEWHVG